MFIGHHAGGGESMMRSTSRAWLGWRRVTAACIAGGAVLAAGCQGTIHDRWAKESDSVTAWGPRLSGLPIAVHGSIPGADQDGTRALVAASAAPASVEGVAGAPGASVPRIVLYVGGDRLPTDATYCAVAPTLRTVRIRAGKVMMAAALCDGPRLVVTSRQEFGVAAVSAAHLPHTLKSIRARLLYALSMSRGQIPAEGTGYS
jgi:hypothetical protein